MGLRKTLWISSLASIVFCASAGADDALDDQTLARRVDGVLVSMRSRTGRGDAVAALRDLGPRAVPRLLHHLRTGRRDVRLLALSCLQYCWEDTAREPVVDALIGDDAMARDLARSVLARHLSPAQLTEAMAPLIDDPDPDVAGPALRAVQRAEPDADALVRSVRIDAPSWGGLVIVEHADEDGALCSLYAHLGSIIPVRAGDRVKAGDLIGTVGRGLTRANGGYHAHLHFGIHRGPYRTAWREGDEVELFVNGAVQRAEVVSVGPEYATFSLAEASKRARLSRRAWIGGYLDPREFRADKHGWVDPQAFLHQRRHASGPSTAPPGKVGRRRRGRP